MKMSCTNMESKLTTKRELEKFNRQIKDDGAGAFAPNAYSEDENDKSESDNEHVVETTKRKVFHTSNQNVLFELISTLQLEARNDMNYKVKLQRKIERGEGAVRLLKYDLVNKSVDLDETKKALTESYLSNRYLSEIQSSSRTIISLMFLCGMSVFINIYICITKYIF